MICPYCNCEMSRGFIRAYGEILTWTPENETKPFTRWGISENGIKLGKYSFFKGGIVNAFYCCNCKKAIIDI